MAVGKRSSERALQKVLGKGANVNAGNPLEVHDPKVGSLISYEGTTTADGAGDGSSLIDSVLTTKPNYNGNLVIITSGAYAGQGRDINAATTGGTVTPASAFGGQILSGTTFTIFALRLTPAEVAALTALVTALMADVGDPTGETLPSLATKWGDIARSLDLILGARWDGAGDLGTDITTILANLATIAGYLDTEIAAILAAVVTEVADILADTNELQTDWADGGRLDLLIDAIKAVTDALPDAGALTALLADIASILALVDSAEAAGPYSYLDAGGEQTVKEDTAVTRRRIWLEFSNRSMTQAGKFIIYRKIDGTNYDIWDTVPCTVAAGDDRAWDAEFTTNQPWKLTYTEDADEGAARAIPYNVITQVIE